jgi:hypothetical protein
VTTVTILVPDGERGGGIGAARAGVVVAAAGSAPPAESVGVTQAPDRDWPPCQNSAPSGFVVPTTVVDACLIDTESGRRTR